MSKLKLSEFAAIAEIVAAVGAIVSMIYVGIAVKENMAEVRATSVQSSVNSSREYLMDIELDEDMSRIQRIGAANLAELSEDEAFRFFFTVPRQLVVYEKCLDSVRTRCP